MDNVMIGRRIKYIRMKGGWGYGTIIDVKQSGCIIAHLDCQGEGEEWFISQDELGKRYFICRDDEQT